MPMEIKLTGDAKDFNRAIEDAGRKLDTLQQKANVGIGGAARSIGGGLSTATRGAASGFGVGGPYSAYERAQTRFQRATPGTTEYLDAQYRLNQSARAVDRAQRQTSGVASLGPSALGVPSMSATTQIGGAITTALTGNPLGAAVSLSSMLGPIGTAAGAGVSAIGTLAGIGAATGSDLERLRYSVGGTIAETSQVKAIGNYSGTDAGASALRLADALHRGTYGAGALRAQGIIDLGGIQTNKATNYLRAADYLTDRSKVSESEAVRIARDVGMSDILWMADLPENERRDALARKGYDSSPRALMDAARFKKDLGDFSQGIGGYGQRALHSIMNPTDIGGLIDFNLEPFRMFGGGITRGIGTLVQNSISSSIGIGKAIGTVIDDVAGFVSGRHVPHPWESNSKATAGATGPTRALDLGDDPRVTPGMVGGLYGAHNAYPSAWANQQMAAALPSEPSAAYKYDALNSRLQAAAYYLGGYPI